MRRLKPQASAVFALVLTPVAIGGTVAVHSQQPLGFDVVSIKRNISGSGSGGVRTLPDGTVIMTNQPMASLIDAVSSEPVLYQNIVGMPGWMTGERYDVTVKPPAGTPRELIPQMWKAMFADRMKLVAHNERREQTTHVLVVARADRRLGPQLKPSTLDCNARAALSSPPLALLTPENAQSRCGISSGGSWIASGAVTMAALARSLIRYTGGPVTDGTGLQGLYAVSMTFAPPRNLATAQDATISDAPDFFTALQEQLGLKLQAGKGMVPVLVIDHIERPTEN